MLEGLEGLLVKVTEVGREDSDSVISMDDETWNNLKATKGRGSEEGAEMIQLLLALEKVTRKRKV